MKLCFCVIKGALERDRPEIKLKTCFGEYLWINIYKRRKIAFEVRAITLKYSCSCLCRVSDGCKVVVLQSFRNGNISHLLLPQTTTPFKFWLDLLSTRVKLNAGEIVNDGLLWLVFTINKRWKLFWEILKLFQKFIDYEIENFNSTAYNPRSKNNRINIWNQ